MKKSFRAIMSMLLICIMLLSVCSFNASAASTIISFSQKSITVGETVSVTVTFNAGEAMYGLEGIVNYDSDLLEYKSGVATSVGGMLKIVESPSGETKTSYKLTFQAKKAGSCVISVEDCHYSGQTTDKGLTGASASLTVTDKSLSSNANLKTLYVNNGRLTPSFSPNNTVYEVSVKNSVTECKISATPADAGAKVTVEGSATLQVGKNTRTVVVTAPSGAVKKYTINITRSETDEEVPIEESPLELDVDGTRMVLATDISMAKLFDGFTASEVDYNGNTVAVAVDGAGEYTIYYLKVLGEDTLVPYLYDEYNGVFEKLKYYTQGENAYIFADIPSDKAVPENFYTTNAQIAGMNVKCYASGEAHMSDFYYVYCYTGWEYTFYRYDTRENTLQRYPELELTNIEVTTPKEKQNIVDRFGSLPMNAKVIVIAIVVVAVAVLALIIILVVKFFRRDRYDDFDDEMLDEDDFDDVEVEGFNFSDDKTKNK